MIPIFKDYYGNIRSIFPMVIFNHTEGMYGINFLLFNDKYKPMYTNSYTLFKEDIEELE